MNKSFTPTFQNFQKDIERHLKSEGKCEKNEHGQTVYHGYQTSLDQMFRAYLAMKAFDPLVAEFRKWNWEWGYNNYLLDLTTHLQDAKNWLLLKELWGAVIAKRKTNYNKTKKAQKAFTEMIPDELVKKTRELLLDSLDRIRNYAIELQQESDIGEYVDMIARVEKRIKA
jgi:hypothetical protein